MAQPTRLATLILASSATIMSSFAFATPAWANPISCKDPSSHCYVMVQFGGNGTGDIFQGDEVATHASCISITSPSTSFVTSETWMVDYSSGQPYWIEAGQAYGYPSGARSYFYWADDRPGHGYAEHDDTSDPPPGTANGDNYRADIYHASSTSYLVYSGTYSGVSTA